MDNIDSNKIEQSPIFLERLKKEGSEALESGIRYLLILACFIYMSFYGLDFMASPEHHLNKQHRISRENRDVPEHV